MEKLCACTTVFEYWKGDRPSPGFSCTEKTLASDPKKGIRLLKLMSFLTGIYPESAQAENHHASFHLRKNDLLGFTLSLKGEYAESFLSRCIHTFFPLDPTFQEFLFRD